MVNTRKNLSAYEGPLPAEGESDRRITAKPLYPKSDVLALLKKDNESIHLWTRKCINDVKNLAWDTEEVKQLIIDALNTGKFLGAEWCDQKPTGPMAACDSYKLVRFEWNEPTQKKIRSEYYVKFAIGKTGKLLLVVSCHLS